MTADLELTDEQYDVADRIGRLLEANPARLWTPSALGRRTKASKGDVLAALRWMELHVFLVGVGNGSWRKYRARRFGEGRA